MSERRKRTKSSEADSEGFTPEERAAMRERAREVRAERRNAQVDGEMAVRAKIAEMPEPDRTLAEHIHAIVTATAPELTPRLWYGMPAYAKDGKVLCFFQGASKFKTRYATLGFTDAAKLDEGTMWPTAYAMIALTPETETMIVALVRKAVGSSPDSASEDDDNLTRQSLDARATF